MKPLPTPIRNHVFAAYTSDIQSIASGHSRTFERTERIRQILIQGDAFGPGSRASRRTNLRCSDPSGFDPYRKGETA